MSVLKLKLTRMQALAGLDFHIFATLLYRGWAVAAGGYSKAPIDKPALLIAMQEKFGLRYEITEAAVGMNATGGKVHYYSLNTRAAGFGYVPGLRSLEGVLNEATACDWISA